MRGVTDGYTTYGIPGWVRITAGKFGIAADDLADRLAHGESWCGWHRRWEAVGNFPAHPRRPTRPYSECYEGRRARERGRQRGPRGLVGAVQP